MRPIKAYREILMKKGLVYSLKEGWRKIQRFHFIRNGRILEMIWEEKAFHSLKRYLPVLDSPCPWEKADPNPYPDRIWVFWMQGEEQAPELVKRCIASIRRYAGSREVVLLTEADLPHYVEFPEYILEKKRRGRISNTHFSDLLRIALLARYGGIWMDATVLQTGPLPEDMTSSPLFCFKSPASDPSPILMSSWFIAAEPGNSLIVRTKQLLDEYWRHKDYLRHYYLFHLFFSLVAGAGPEYIRQWKAVPNYNNAGPHTLLHELGEPYDEKEWNRIKALSPVHKLTYKYSRETAEAKDSFLQMILRS